MFRLNSGSSDNTPTRTKSKGGLKTIASRLRPELRLAVDTDVSRHQGAVPELVFPYETRSQRRSVGQTASILSQRRRANPASLGRKYEAQDAIQDDVARSYSVKSHAQSSHTGLPSRPDINRHPHPEAALQSDGLAAPALHNRVKGLRPSPLNLIDISPSDRAIPIGITIPSAAISDHTTSPLTATHRTYSPPQHGNEAVTPTITVTPAREDFDLTPPSYTSHHGHAGRTASSVYSRYTNCAPTTTDCVATPPVPPLPLFAQQPRKQSVPESKLPTYEESRSAVSHKATLSVCTVFEEDEHLQAPRSARSFLSPRLRSVKRQSTLPTPRRSRGWWNVITSPFSARSNGLFYKSPTDDASDRTAILSDASAMGVDYIAHEKFDQTLKAVDDTEPRSAPATNLRAVPYLDSKSTPKRSFTAPGALDPNADVMNIYRIPSQGAAAAYYDQSRNFPSLILDSSDAIPKSMFEDDSPLTDVCACEGHRHGKASELWDTKGIEDGKRTSECSRCSRSVEAREALNDSDLKSPFDDSHAIDKPGNPPHIPDRTVFTSPTADELLSPSPTHTTHDRDQTDATGTPRESVDTVTPVLQDAHVGTLVGPRSSNGEPKAVIIPPSRAPSPSTGVAGLPDIPNKTSSLHTAELVDEPVNTVRDGNQRPPMHSREGSCGLGISTGEQDLFPPPEMLSEKPRLGTDRFGQLVIVTEKQRQPAQPWYRRFFWLLVAAFTSLLLLLFVLLIVFIPQHHADNGVQVQWLNLTGFPPLPTGVATIIQPKKTLDESRCIDPPSLWSCAMPPSQLAPEDRSELPNFRFDVRFRNHTLENTTALVSTANYSLTSGPASVKSQLRSRSVWSGLLYSPNPPPPSEADQLALRSNTDDTSTPFNGEETPFYLSLLDPSPLTRLDKRDASNREDLHTFSIPNPYPYPTPSNTTTSKRPSTAVPKPLLLPNGRPNAPLLYPYATAQPLRLYNRGLEDEHYGFYTYFAKSVLVANETSPSGSLQTQQATNLTTTSSSANAQALCSFAQTRFRVQIWTRRFVAAVSSDWEGASIPAAQSSANEMEAPGSFPYGVSVLSDRESGPEGDEGKGVFCWALDGKGRVIGEGVRVDEGKAKGGEVARRDNGEKCGCEWES